MRINFSDRSEGIFEIRYIFDPDTTRIIKAYLELKRKFTETIAALKTLGELSEGAKQPDLIKWYEHELQELKGSITKHSKQPVKTIVTFCWGGRKWETYAKISEEDADIGLHSRKIGREVACRKLMKQLGSYMNTSSSINADQGKKIRGELAAKLGLTKK
jgi:hypothetical protein